MFPFLLLQIVEVLEFLEQSTPPPLDSVLHLNVIYVFWVNIERGRILVSQIQIALTPLGQIHSIRATL